MHGRLAQKDGQWSLRFERRLPHPPEKVWRALVEPEHLAAWFPSSIEGERAAGASLRFVFPGTQAPAIDGEMLVYDPPSALEYRWGDELLRFDLHAEGGGCLLTFVNTFDEIGKAARDAAGWHACLDVLAVHLAGETAPWTPEARWQDVHAGYVEQFGPEAATIGPPDWADDAAAARTS
jgi:uncharacterized protein YndB with AHSA1/START domain